MVSHSVSDDPHSPDVKTEVRGGGSRSHTVEKGQAGTVSDPLVLVLHTTRARPGQALHAHGRQTGMDEQTNEWNEWKN